MAKNKKSKVICDIDGTIANAGRPIKAVCKWVKKKADEGKEIVYLTNRSEEDRKVTLDFLKENEMPYATSRNLIMNDSGLDAPVFKKEKVEDMIANGDTIYAFIDDRLDTREAIRSIEHPIIVLSPQKMYKKKDANSASMDSFSADEQLSHYIDKVINHFTNAIEKYAKAADSIKVPKFIRDNAKRGLELNKQGFGGDGLVDKTIREARDMANGKITLDKCVRMSAWFARHKVDTKSEGFKNKKSPKYPSAGLVAWLLWGGDADGSFRAKDWADSQVNKSE